MDTELRDQRNKRWERAFHPNFQDQSEKEGRDRKATIIIEHMIQASDVAHTMQHWHVYRSWNERLFHEVYSAYLNGRGEQNPALGWYEGEIAFFDFYVIPLAKKLKECGVFGVSSDEYLDYALGNREEWVQRGEAMVKSYLTSINQKEESTT